ncbi:hypothetical protein LepocDRAFT_00002410 [Leptothrix ochracea L12]|uniref:Outer membrane protein H.8 n=1 Tax=Leptothrix ochracea L12 TaxID=735332 RepID=I4Z5L8_9BURK|nr:hypothetical protein [Leptothrix ochracea]EIM31510.1 hypothetical protein LepocDRAFT_00002410 [Leptothrix ochracea L12]
MKNSLLIASLIAVAALAACGKKPEAAPAPAAMVASAPAAPASAASADAAASGAAVAASGAAVAASAAASK